MGKLQKGMVVWANIDDFDMCGQIKEVCNNGYVVDSIFGETLIVREEELQIAVNRTPSVGNKVWVLQPRKLIEGEFTGTENGNYFVNVDDTIHTFDHREVFTDYEEARRSLDFYRNISNMVKWLKKQDDPFGKFIIEILT